MTRGPTGFQLASHPIAAMFWLMFMFAAALIAALAIAVVVVIAAVVWAGRTSWAALVRRRSGRIQP